MIQYWDNYAKGINDRIRVSMKQWLSVKDVAIHLGVSKETIYRLLKDKKIPCHRIGKLWKFKPSEIDAWVIRKESILERLFK